MIQLKWLHQAASGNPLTNQSLLCKVELRKVLSVLDTCQHKPDIMSIGQKESWLPSEVFEPYARVLVYSELFSL